MRRIAAVHIPSEEGLVACCEHEDRGQDAECKGEPERRSPLAQTGDHPVRPLWAYCWSDQDDSRKYTDLARLLVQEEHVFDKRNSDGLAACQEETLQRPEGVVLCKVRGQRGAEDE